LLKDDVEGIVVDEVLAGSPADNAGLDKGDVILMLDDTAVNQYLELNDFMKKTLKDDFVVIIYTRKGEKKETKLNMGL